MNLSELKTGQTGVIVKIHGHGAFRKRVIAMGFVAGKPVTVLLHAPLRDPINFSIMGYEISLRRCEARQIEVVPVETPDAVAMGARALDKSIEESAHAKALEQARRDRHQINVALIGNPNCGKTSLFNKAVGASEHVGNYSGVTVDAKEGNFEYNGYKIKLIDLPGTYSLTCYTPEELYVRQYLCDYTPDVIINVVDSSNLERNLFLSTELIDMDRRMIIALNMWDDLRASGAQLDYDALGRMIGVPMVPIVARSGEGVNVLFDTVIQVYENRNEAVRHVHVNLGNDLEAAIRRLVDMLKAHPDINSHFSPRYLAIKLLEGDHAVEDEMEQASHNANVQKAEIQKECSPAPKTFLKRVLSFFRKDCCEAAPAESVEPWKEHVRAGSDSPVLMLRDKLRAHVEEIHGQDISSMVAAEKYGFIAGALAETYTPGRKDSHRTTRILDHLATNKWLGFPIFFAIMFLIFWLTFFVGQYPMEWIENGVAWLSQLVSTLMPAGPLKDMIADGIIGGVGGVIVFLPNILILYFCISFMEDSGYMARAAFIMDRVMHRIGLHGKSFIPLIMGFGCNVPAIMASRAIESKSSRLITILINPFMSCSARLPIYVLLIGTFFAPYAAWVFMGLYFGGILVAVITARLLRRFLFPTDETPFVMELPPYRMPTLRASGIHTWGKCKEYLKKMGGIILFASILVWALNYFPLNRTPRSADPTGVLADDTQIDPAHDSYLEIAGKAINPLMKPLGFSWRASVAALAGVPAKEIVVSTLGVLYTNDEATTDTRLGARLQEPATIGGKPDFSPAVAMSFMVFILLYCPCIATVTAIIRETGSWRYGLFSVVYNTVVAWLVAFGIYHIMI